MVTTSTQPDGRQYARPAYAWTVVGALMVALAVSLMDRQLLSIVVQPIQEDLGITDVQIGLLNGLSFVIFYSTFGLIMGRLADRLNRRNMIVVGLVLWCFATAACGLARNFPELFLARMFVGIGEAALAPCAYSMIADYFPNARRARAAGIYTSGIYFGPGIALLFGGVLVAALTRMHRISIPFLGIGPLHPWQATFIIVGLPGLILGAFLWFFVKEPARHERSGQGANLAQTLRFFRSRAGILALLIAGFTLNNLVGMTLNLWVPSLYIRVFGWTIDRIGPAYGIILFLGPIGILTGGWIADRFTARGHRDGALRTMIWSVGLLTPAAALIGLAPTAPLSLAALLAVTLLMGMPPALGPVTLYRIVPNEYRGQVIALLYFCSTGLGMSLGPVLVGGIHRTCVPCEGVPRTVAVHRNGPVGPGQPCLSHLCAQSDPRLFTP